MRVPWLFALAPPRNIFLLNGILARLVLLPKGGRRMTWAPPDVSLHPGELELAGAVTGDEVRG